MDTNGGEVCTEARIGMFGVGSIPLRAHRAEEKLRGSRLEDPLFQEAAKLASQETEPESDVYATAEYRREVVKYLVEWSLGDARLKLERKS